MRNLSFSSLSATAARIAALALAVVLATPFAASANQSEVDVWEALIRPNFFGDAKLLDGKDIIELKTPYRAEDAAFTPVSINAKLKQTDDRYIETLHLFVDKNPEPHVGAFHLTPELGRADLSMRIRIEQYTNVRAVAVMNTGEHYLVTNFVKAQGGCSAPAGSDFERAMARIGKMKFRTVGDPNPDETVVGQFNLSHPNVTGMQKDQRTHLIRPAHFVKTVKLSLDGQHILTAETGISISEDPSFRFFFKPHEGGTLTAEVEDSKGMAWTETFDIGV